MKVNKVTPVDTNVKIKRERPPLKRHHHDDENKNNNDTKKDTNNGHIDVVAKKDGDGSTGRGTQRPYRKEKPKPRDIDKYDGSVGRDNDEYNQLKRKKDLNAIASKNDDKKYYVCPLCDKYTLLIEYKNNNCKMHCLNHKCKLGKKNLFHPLGYILTKSEYKLLFDGNKPTKDKEWIIFQDIDEEENFKLINILREMISDRDVGPQSVMRSILNDSLTGRSSDKLWLPKINRRRSAIINKLRNTT